MIYIIMIIIDSRAPSASRPPPLPGSGQGARGGTAATGCICIYAHYVCILYKIHIYTLYTIYNMLYIILVIGRDIRPWFLL